MSVSINWETKIITIPQTYLTHITGVYYRLNVDDFRLTLKDIEDSEDGIIFPDTHRHNTEVTIGGITLARTVEIINDYTVTFEDGQYAVIFTGANNNILDVLNFNQVSVQSSNTAGLIVSGSGITEQDKTDIGNEVWTNTYGEDVSNKIDYVKQIQNNRWKIADNQLIIYGDNGIIPMHIFNLYNKDGDPSETEVYERVPV